MRLWRELGGVLRLRRSIESPDYDEAAYYSIIPLQRYWQRRRHRIVTTAANGCASILDIGCGSSRIVQGLSNAVGLDINLGKLHYLRRYPIPLVCGSAYALPFEDDSFDCVISSQVIEHIAYRPELFTEMRRVLKAGGTLIIGTPDYASWGWRIIEPLYGLFAPHGYRDEHITHYTRATLTSLLWRHGFAIEKTFYIMGSEMIMRCRKKRAWTGLKSHAA